MASLLHFSLLGVTWLEITGWTVCALLAAGIGWSKWEKQRTRDKYLAELAALPPEKREALLLRLSPKLQAEVRQRLMMRYGLS